MSVSLMGVRLQMAAALAGCLFMAAWTAGCSGTADETAGGQEAASTPVVDCPVFVEASESLPDSGEWRTHPAVGDLNGDGLGDIAAIRRKGHGPRVFLGDGLGGWQEASEGLGYNRASSCGIGTRFVDFDRDGKMDLLVADHCQGIHVYRGDGGTRNLQGFNSADAGDLNGDGLADIVAISAYSRGFLVLLATPSGKWKVAHETGLPDGGSGFKLRLRDVNGDGRLDILTNYNPSDESRTAPAPPALIWLQTAGGTFRPAEGFSNRARFMGVATWPGPGGEGVDVFISLVGAQAGIHLYRSEDGEKWVETARIAGSWFPGEPSAYVDVATADFNGDGCVDLVTTEARTRKILVAMGTCKDEWQLCPEDTLPLDLDVGGWGIATGDLNGDGRTDVVAGFGSESVGGLKAWYQAGHGS
ncbi:MAG: FG-GAP repeat domain-containing protein [Acidobacteriota bacterium]